MSWEPGDFDALDRDAVDLSSVAEVSCPWCGEAVSFALEADLEGEWVQDCEVCCQPWRVRRSSAGLLVDRDD